MLEKSRDAENAFERNINRITEKVGASLTNSDWEELAKADDSIDFHHSLGMYIRNTYQLWGADWISYYHPDDVSDIIIGKLMANAREKVH